MLAFKGPNPNPSTEHSTYGQISGLLMFFEGKKLPFGDFLLVSLRKTFPKIFHVPKFESNHQIAKILLLVHKNEFPRNGTEREICRKGSQVMEACAENSQL